MATSVCGMMGEGKDAHDESCREPPLARKARSTTRIERCIICVYLLLSVGLCAADLDAAPSLGPEPWQVDRDCVGAGNHTREGKLGKNASQMADRSRDLLKAAWKVRNGCSNRHHGSTAMSGSPGRISEVARRLSKTASPPSHAEEPDVASAMNASMSVAGRAPVVRPASRPPRKTAMVGIERMANRSPRSDSASVLTLTMR